MHYKSTNYHRGFTLLELLVVISIIALLSSVMLASFAQVKTKASNSQTLAEVNEYQTAFEQYYIDYGRYPADTSPGDSIRCIGHYNSANKCMWAGDYHNESTKLNSEMGLYIPSLPAVNKKQISVLAPYNLFQGAVYRCIAATDDDGNVFTPPAKCDDFFIYWVVEGTTCQKGTVILTDGINTICQMEFKD